MELNAVGLPRVVCCRGSGVSREHMPDAELTQPTLGIVALQSFPAACHETNDRDASGSQPRERVAVDVHSQHAVALEKPRGDGTRAAPKIEHVTSWTADCSDQQRQAFRDEYELPAGSPQPVVSGIRGLQTSARNRCGVQRPLCEVTGSRHSADENTVFLTWRYSGVDLRPTRDRQPGQAPG